MMVRLLKAIIEGDLFPWESKFYTNDRLQDINQKLLREEESFLSRLSDEDKKRAEECFGLLLDRHYEESSTEKFEQFMLGIVIGMEIAEWKYEKNVELDT